MNETPEFKELIRVALEYAKSTWRFRWFGLGLAWFIFLAGSIFVYTMPDQYAASARVYVDVDGVLRPLLKGLSVETNVQSEISVMTQALTSRPQLTAVARITDLDLRAHSPGDMEVLLNSLKERISVKREPNGFYEISYSDANKAMSLNVVQTLLNTFIESTIGSNEQESEDAGRTLEAQLNAYEQRLVDSENRLKVFKQKNVGFMPDSGGDYYERLQTSQAEAAGFQEQLKIAKEQLAAIQRQILGEEPVFGLMPSSPGSSAGQSSGYDDQIDLLRHRLSDLAIQYTDLHPEVKRTKSEISRLEGLRQEQIASMPSIVNNQASSPLDLNPVYQNLRMRENDISVEIAKIAAQTQASEGRIQRLKEMVDIIPEVETELNRLNRDYGVVKARHAEMLERWETLQTSKQVNAGTSEMRFRVVEPPFAKSEPVGPPRTIYLAGFFFLSLGFGITVIAVMAFLNPVYVSAEGLRNLGASVIGEVTIFYNESNVATRALASNYAFIFAIMGLVGCLVVFMFGAEIFPPILQRLF